MSTVFLLAMSDAADKASADTERAMDLLEEQIRRQRVADSHRSYAFNPDKRCEECGEPIGAERLKLLCHTARCAPCATVAEKRYARAPFA